MKIVISLLLCLFLALGLSNCSKTDDNKSTKEIDKSGSDVHSEKEGDNDRDKHSDHDEDDDDRDKHSDHDEDDDDHDKHNDDDEYDDDHDKHSDDDHDNHSDHDDMDVKITSEGIKLAGIKTSTVEKEKILKQIELPGEISFNEDQLVNITPRFPGVVRKIKVQIGQYVKKGTVLAVVEGNESFSTYNIISPISGRVLNKDVSLGEFVSEESEMFKVANLSRVWVNCQIYPQDIKNVRRGSKILIKEVGTDKTVNGVVSYVSQVFDESTRSALVRTVISSSKGQWLPGMFVKGIIQVESDEAVVAVKNDAVQIMDGKSVVFVPEGKNTFEVKEVKVGLSNENYTEVTSGLNEGESYVSEGAFELKAKIVTSALGGHAGHGH